MCVCVGGGGGGVEVVPPHEGDLKSTKLDLKT